MLRLFVWRVGVQHFALPFAAVSKVVRAVAMTAVPAPTPFVCGVVNIHGKIVPVVDIRKRFLLAERELAPADHFIVACTPQRMLVLWVDAAQGVIEYHDEALGQAGIALPDASSPSGVVKLPGGLMLLQDIERCLSFDGGCLPEIAR